MYFRQTCEVLIILLLNREKIPLRAPLPAPPRVFFGREAEQLSIIQALTSQLAARIVILGFGGIGKTTLALSVLHSTEILEHYAQRFFVHCDLIVTVDQLVSAFADALHIPRTTRDSTLRNLVLHELSQGPFSLICLDNFETIWDPFETRGLVEALLLELDGIPKLSVILTMRGTQRPASMHWSKPLLQPLEPLSLQDSKRILSSIADIQDNEYTDKLLAVAGGIPLTATLIANLLRDELETPASLWSRWRHEKTSMLETGGDRHSSLDVSIQVSLLSPRMKVCQYAIPLLAMLALLPNGFPDDGTLRSTIRYKLSDIGQSYDESIQALKRVALVSVDKSGSRPRLQLLPPIRYYCQAHFQPIDQGLFSAFTYAYMKFIEDNYDYSIASLHVPVSEELPNLRVLFQATLKRGPVTQDLIRSISLYTEWCLYLGDYSDDVVTLAIQRAQTRRNFMCCIIMK
jgi:hypothetical protein